MAELGPTWTGLREEAAFSCEATWSAGGGKRAKARGTVHHPGWCKVRRSASASPGSSSLRASTTSFERRQPGGWELRKGVGGWALGGEQYSGWLAASPFPRRTCQRVARCARPDWSSRPTLSWPHGAIRRARRQAATHAGGSTQHSARWRCRAPAADPSARFLTSLMGARPRTG